MSMSQPNVLPAMAQVTLSGTHVRLLPLSPDHAPALVQAASEDPTLYAWNVVPREIGAMERYIASALRGAAEGHMAPFAIERRADDVLVGSTRFYSMERWVWPPGHPEHGRGTPDVCEVGYTWLARSALRTPINTEAKLLLFRHAFETWHVHRVALRTDARNARSRAAIERLGARLDGCLRAERAGADGAVRDSALYSVVAAEWPAIRVRLEGFLAHR